MSKLIIEIKSNSGTEKYEIHPPDIPKVRGITSITQYKPGYQVRYQQPSASGTQIKEIFIKNRESSTLDIPPDNYTFTVK